MIDISTKNAAAKGLAKWLEPLHSADGEHLISVSTNAEGNKILLSFESGALVLQLDEEDDTVTISYVGELGASPNCALDISAKAPWSSLVGKPFGWSWATVNQQGYVDGVLLSSGGVTPEVAVTVVASSFRIRQITEAVA